jgi:hypothetical protein
MNRTAVASCDIRLQILAFSLISYLTFATPSQAQRFVGSGPYHQPNVQLDTRGPGYWSSYSYNDLCRPGPKTPLVVPGKGTFFVRDQRDVKMLCHNLGVPVPPAGPAAMPQGPCQAPGPCNGGVCPGVRLVLPLGPRGQIQNFNP